MSKQADKKAITGNMKATRIKSVSIKAVYSKNAAKKLAETKAKLGVVNAKIKNAVATGRLEANEQLELAQNAVEVNLATVETRLARLRKSSEEIWEKLRDDVENAWEDLSRSVKQLVTRFADRSK